VLRGAGASLLGAAGGGAADGAVSDRERQAPGWPGFLNGTDKLRGVEPPSRGGLFDSQQLIGEMSLATAQSTRVPSSSLAGLAATQTEFLRASAIVDAPAEHFSNLKRPATPILAYVDRAAFPGYIEQDNCEERDWQIRRDGRSGFSQSPVAARMGSPSRGLISRDLPLQPGPAAGIASWGGTQAPAGTGSAANADDRWEQELAEWKRKYGCPADESHAAVAETLATAAALSATAAASSTATPLPADPLASMPMALVARMDRELPTVPDAMPPMGETNLSGRALVAVPLASDRTVADDPNQLGWLTREPWPTAASVGPGDSQQTNLPDDVAGADAWGQAPPPFPLGSGSVGPGDSPPFPLGSGRSADPAPVSPPARLPSDPGFARLPAPPPFPMEAGASDAAMQAPLPFPFGMGDNDAGRPVGTAGTTQILEHALQTPGSPNSTTLAVRPPDPTASRRFVYTQQDLDVATKTAKNKLMADGSYNTEYSEAGIQIRDFFLDLRKQRAKDKGRQATGPIWIHLAAQAKNLASTFKLNMIIEAFKLFCSVRYEDYELYMRLLGEVPHYIKLANADQLCELVRLLSRRRLRERNYVDMIAAHLLQKIRVTDDSLPARLLIKAANAFAGLECRSQPKFVEHFLRHVEHRIEELDGDACCLVTPCFVANYMSDALRRAFLKRCAETQAGFHGEMDLLRNLAMIELVIRKEHHSFAVSLPPYVTRYLEKVKQHAHFDKWGAVTLPASVAPDGPKGSHKAEMSLSLQRKASTATGGLRGDVFSSDMHRDVSACLNHLGIEHENGVLCGPFLLDIIALDMVNPSKRITYEINSPHHYYEGTETLLAEKRLRHRMLGRLSQKLHHVHAHDWRALSAAQKMTFILKLQQTQQDENSQESKKQAAANTMRAPIHPVPMLPYSAAKKPEPLVLKSARKMGAPPIRVPTPPSLKTRAPLTAR